MEYRIATAADAHLLAAMNHQLIRMKAIAIRCRSPNLETVRMQAWLDGESTRPFCSKTSRESAWYALFKREPDWIYLRQFFVQPERRRRGIGREAVRWLLENVWKDASRIRLDVTHPANSSGIEFWRSLGFSNYCVTLEKPVTKWQKMLTMEPRAVMGSALNLKNGNCLVSAIHGLGHSALDAPRAKLILQSWLRRPTTQNKFIREYARHATTGQIM